MTHHLNWGLGSQSCESLIDSAVQCSGELPEIVSNGSFLRVRIYLVDVWKKCTHSFLVSSSCWIIRRKFIGFEGNGGKWSCSFCRGQLLYLSTVLPVPIARIQAHKSELIFTHVYLKAEVFFREVFTTLIMFSLFVVLNKRLSNA